MKQITPEEITQAASSANGYKVYASATKAEPFDEGFKVGAEWAISQMQLEWLSMPPKQLLDDGFYYVKLYHPETKVEGIKVIEIGGSNRIINYHYAVAYCPIPQPPTK